MRIDTLRKEGYELLHEGVIALGKIESTGIRIDQERLAHTKVDLAKKIKDIRAGLTDTKVWRRWKKRFGEKSNLTSRDQLSTIFYEELGYEITDRTDTEKASTDEEALQKIDHPFIAPLLRLIHYDKALGTFIKGIEKEVAPDGRLHPVFNLHTARTYRSSSDSPNFQNFPVRDKEIAQIIRSLFIASSAGHTLVENDFKGIEVGVSACYHRDANFISYITTPGKDMHRDMAAQIYKMAPEEVGKDVRYGAKNKFVFPQFYGDYYKACAKNLWEWITKGNLKGPKGIPMMEHLANEGITEMGDCDKEAEPVEGTFEKHLQDVERDFWDNRFMDYGKWRKDTYKSYLQKGYFDLHTGFRIFGFFGRNEVTNYPIQGSAFHCLLWCLIQVVNDKLPKYGLKSRVVGQIHDSLIGDVVVSELRDYLEIIEETATVDLREHYRDWLIVPLEIEYEISPSEGSWFDKKETKFKKGVFTHPTDPKKKTRDPEKFMEVLNRGLKK